MTRADELNAEIRNQAVRLYPKCAGLFELPLMSRQEEIDYLNKHGFSADFTKLKYSYNVGLWGSSICGGEILDSAQGLPETAYLKPVSYTHLCYIPIDTHEALFLFLH